jgi:putative oxidoreductase
MMASVGLPANMAMGVGVFELVAGLLLAIGLMTRLVSIVLFAYIGLTILFFHNALADPAQQVNALKNLAMMGGMLTVFAYGQMRWSYDHWRARDKVHDAELRAARAEGKAEGATAVAGDHTTTVVREPVVEEPVVRRTVVSE